MRGACALDKHVGQACGGSERPQGQRSDVIVVQEQRCGGGGQAARDRGEMEPAAGHDRAA